MRLTRLEAKGFKSFGDKIILHFGAGVTGVVGPNGCGKSNIVDAIRWVLGETRTRALRSEKMENMIFNGSANRKPLQMCEVTLTFENDRGILPAEYHTVAITRRYHRNGESEYMLNGVHCRLKDIDSLLADTGIGPDSYAIIELRMVDDILSDKDGSRRLLFEEAAGVSRFKQRRKETLRKLDDVRQDVDRVEDLLHEIERNLKNLEKQARQAEKYFEIKDKAKAFGIAAALREMTRRGEELTRLQEQSKALTQERDLLVSQTTAQDTQRDQWVVEVKAAEEAFSAWQKTYAEKQDHLRSIETEKKLSSERRRSGGQRKDQLTGQREADLHQLLHLTATQDELRTRLAELTVQEAEARGKLSGVQADLSELQADFETKSTNLSSSEKELLNVTESLQKLQKEEEVGQARAQALAQEKTRIEAQSQAQTESLNQAQGYLGSLSQKLEELTGRLNQLKEAEEKRLEKQKTVQATIEELREQTGMLARRRDALQNEYNLTKSLQDNLEGYPEAIRFLRKSKDWSAAEQVPLVSDLFATPEKYRIALEFFLEPVLNHYVVESEAEALRAVNLLGASGKGKASFFVLNRFYGMPEPDYSFPAGSIPALEVIDCEPQHMPLVRWLLGGVCFMDKPVASSHPDVTVLAVEGNLVLRHRTVAGGSIGLYEGKRIGRVKNLEKLAAELQVQNKRLQDLEQSQRAAREELEALRQADAAEALRTLQDEHQKLEQETLTWKVRREQAQISFQTQETQLAQLTDSLIKLEAEAQERGPLLSTLAFRSTELSQNLLVLRQAKQEAESWLGQRREELNKGQLEALRLLSELNQAQKELQIRDENQNRLSTRLAQTEQELAAVEAELETLNHADSVGDEGLHALYDELKGIDAQVKEAGQKLYTSKETLENHDKTVRELGRRRDQNQTLLSEIAARVSGQEARLEATKERLALEFSIGPDVGTNTLEPETEEISQLADAELVQKAAHLKDQLERLGPINPVAMENYQEMKERHDFILTQKQDLGQAQKSLETTIAEIETEAHRAFMATFTAVRENFHTVFKTLFTNEDTCDLTLQDPSRPLESPIEIIARPKGKRPLSINQLSGGEKTLTATALLFSIYLIKPAPFCIFDEVDAPLDDNNIDKFNNIIKEFSAQSQFIIVTHNKRTMTHADILYGVTMVEQGVSRVIPVDLR